MGRESDLLRAVERSLRGAKPSPHAPVIDPLDLLGLVKLKAFARLSRSLHSVLEPRALLVEIVDRAVELTGAEHGVIVIREVGSGELLTHVARHMTRRDLADAKRISRRTIDRALRGDFAVYAAEPTAGDADGAGARPAVAVASVPLRVRERVIGAAYVERHGDPFGPEDIGFLAAFAELAAVALDNVRLLEDLERQNRELRQEVGRAPAAGGLVGTSPVMRDIYALLERVAPTDTSVLIEGESGTGKELIARAIHGMSRRRDAKFVAVHCGAIPDDLIESELFGHRRGSFSGAIADRVGLFQEADGGTLFLDEIHAAPPGVQVKLLRALQEREIRPVGDNASRKVDVRLIAAANRPLEAQVASGLFREDLYFRLAVVTICAPPLRRRKEDILPIASHILERLAAGSRRRRLSRAAIDALLEHDWPGNVRELENVLQKACVMAAGSRIDVADLGLAPRRHAGGPTLGDALRALERKLVEEALDRAGGNVSHAASSLGILRQQLQRLLRRHAIDPRETKRRRYLAARTDTNGA